MIETCAPVRAGRPGPGTWPMIVPGGFREIFVSGGEVESTSPRPPRISFACDWFLPSRFGTSGSAIVNVTDSVVLDVRARLRGLRDDATAGDVLVRDLARRVRRGLQVRFLEQHQRGRGGAPPQRGHGRLVRDQRVGEDRAGDQRGDDDRHPVTGSSGFCRKVPVIGRVVAVSLVEALRDDLEAPVGRAADPVRALRLGLEGRAVAAPRLGDEALLRELEGRARSRCRPR